MHKFYNANNLFVSLLQIKILICQMCSGDRDIVLAIGQFLQLDVSQNRLSLNILVGPRCTGPPDMGPCWTGTHPSASDI